MPVVTLLSAESPVFHSLGGKNLCRPAVFMVVHGVGCSRSVLADTLFQFCINGYNKSVNGTGT